MKTCITCKEEKKLDQFSVRKTGSLVSECKICSAKRSNRWYRENKEKSLINRKKYYEENREEALKKWKERYEKHGPEIRRKANERNKNPEQREKGRIRTLDWTRKNKEKVSRKSIEWKRANPEKAKAHQYILWALRLNVLQKPATCQACGETKRLEAHHSDYSKPLDVMWLCKICHEKEHHKDKYERSSTSGLDVHLHRKEGEEVDGIG